MKISRKLYSYGFTVIRLVGIILPRCIEAQAPPLGPKDSTARKRQTCTFIHVALIPNIRPHLQDLGTNDDEK